MCLFRRTSSITESPSTYAETLHLIVRDLIEDIPCSMLSAIVNEHRKGDHRVVNSGTQGR